MWPFSKIKDLVIILFLITALISAVIGHMIGEKYGQAYLGGLIGLVFWAWILVSFVMSDEFIRWMN